MAAVTLAAARAASPSRLSAYASMTSARAASSGLPGQLREPAHPQCLRRGCHEMRSRVLGVADDDERGGPESVHQRPLLHHLHVDLNIVAERNGVQELVGLLKEVYRAQCHRHCGARREVAVAARLRIRDEPRSLGQCVHRPADLSGLCRGLRKKGEGLGPPHRVGVVLHVDEKIQGHSHRLVVPTRLLQGDPLDVAQVLSTGPVTCSRGHEQTLPAREHRLLRESVNVQLVRVMNETVKRPEPAHPYD